MAVEFSRKLYSIFLCNSDMIGQNFHDQNCVNWHWYDYIDCLLNVSENRKLCVLSEHNTRFLK